MKIFGVVHGVFFRHYAKKIADSLSIKGFIRNEPDGSVCIEAEGSDEALNKFIDWCKKGPPLAKVDRVETEKGEHKNFPDFSVR